MSADEALAAVRAAMQGHDWRLEAVLCFGGPSSIAVQVYVKAQGKRYAKVGPLIFPPDDGTLADTLSILGGLAVEEAVS